MNKLFIFFVFIMFSFVAQAQKGKPILSIGLITDIQYADAPSKGTRYYKNSLLKLRACINELNEKKVNFSLNLGDIIDRNASDLDSVLFYLKGLQKPIYTTTGNHDYQEIKENKNLFGKLGMPAEYYAFEKKNCVFIMMNTNEIAQYANNADTWKENELKEMLDSIKAVKGVNGAEYNGGISSKQLIWLNKQLQNAQKLKKNVFIFSHHPLDFSSGFTALNSKPILDVIARYNCVKAIFAGHHHQGDFGYHLSIPCITLEGMVETAKENAYAVLEIYQNRFEIKGVGRTTSRQFKIN